MFKHFDLRKWASLGALLLVCGCTRFGEAYQLDENGEIPRYQYAAVPEAEALRNYQHATLHEVFKDKEVVIQKWAKLRTDLAAPGSEKKQERVGRLLGIASRDKSGVRQVLVDLWAIQYGNLNEEDGKTAEKFLLEQVMVQTDIFAMALCQSLLNVVMPPENLTAEQERELERIERLFRTGEGVREAAEE